MKIEWRDIDPWNGLLAVRALAPDGRTLQRDIGPIVEALSGRPLPRAWQC